MLEHLFTSVVHDFAIYTLGLDMNEWNALDMIRDPVVLRQV
jgi:hypothetical protein